MYYSMASISGLVTNPTVLFNISNLVLQYFVFSQLMIMLLIFFSIAIPPRSYSIKTYYENSTKVLEIYNLKRYERKLRVSTKELQNVDTECWFLFLQMWINVHISLSNMTLCDLLSIFAMILHLLHG